jgi:hypothetical protein
VVDYGTLVDWKLNYHGHGEESVAAYGEFMSALPYISGLIFHFAVFLRSKDPLEIAHVSE